MSPTNRQSWGFNGLFLAVLIALALCAWLFPAGFITGTGPYWQAQTEDITQYLSGFWFFMSEPWSWPLWKIQSINWPSGTLSTFVDIIPLYAAILKGSSFALWEVFKPPFNPFGYWVGLCLVLQAIGAWWLLKEARISGWFSLISFVLLLLLFPSWLMRMGHISLLSHWLILFGFALILRAWRTAHFPALAWGTLITVGFFINIYLCAMVSLLCASQWLAALCVVGNKIERCKLLLWVLAMCLIMAALIGITMWPLPAASGQIEPGFGIYSLNILSPINGGIYLSHLLSNVSADQQFEGFNYLGIGILFLIAALIAHWLTSKLAVAKHLVPRMFNHNHAHEIHNRNAAFLRANTPNQGMQIWGQRTLVLLLCALTMYALSNQIYFGSALIYQWSVPQWAQTITGQMRASGRFFWVVAYAMTIFTFLTIARRFSTRTRNLIFAIALCLQAFDLWPYITKLRTLNSHAPAPVIDMAQWQKAIPSTKQVMYFFPKFKCAQHSSPLNTLMPMQLLAAQTGRKINTAYVARYTPTCSQEAQEIMQSNNQDSVYIFTNAEYSSAQILAFFPRHWTTDCHTLDFATLCSAVNNANLK